MDRSNYEFETFDTSTQGETETRIKIPLEKLFIGQKIYQVDFFYPDGIQELEVRDILLEKKDIDSQTGEEFTRPIKAGEKYDDYSIGLGEDWDTHPYEKYLTKEDAYEASLENHKEFIRHHQQMVDSWQHSINNTHKRMSVIQNKLNALRSNK